MDEWDNLILPKEVTNAPPLGAKINLAGSIADEDATLREKKKSLIPDLKKKDLSILSGEPEKSLSPYSFPSSFGPSLPALRGMEWANKFATAAVALAIVFGVYSYAGYISEMGVSNVADATVASLEKMPANVLSALGF